MLENPWNPPHICDNCDREPCTNSPDECEQDARDTAGCNRYHEMREGMD